MKIHHKSGTGFSRNDDAFLAGREAARAAITRDGIVNPCFILAFCAGIMDHRLFVKGIRDIAGNDVPVLGGSAIGVMNEDELNYRGSSAGCLIIGSEGITVCSAVEKSLNNDTFGAGKRLGERLAETKEPALMMLFYDSIAVPATQSSPPVLNSSAPLLSGLMTFTDASVPVIGAGLVGSYSFEAVSLLTGFSVERDCAAAITFNGAIKPYYQIMHGCSPLDGVYHRITRKEGSVLYELDDRPITEVIDDLGVEGWRNQFPLEYLTIGVNCGERYGSPQEEHYINRLITGLTPDGMGICMFEPDLAQGTEIQFMIRDTEKMMESVQRNCSKLIEEIDKNGDRPFCSLYIDCAGRTAEYSRTSQEEAAEVQRMCRDLKIPLLGFYSGVEIAPLMGKPRGLDWTGVLLILTEKSS